ncbi:PREDICTED: uncharacterized protein C9orf85 homolog, partial [Ceratosolen solmsi marchali]|uniref:Uncharacterized protein C9orf85 homolog n=1 Tax=Ceratosolen solmsi marchali TaxID=326594 RepID=A0AAJ6VJM7_9HYME
MSTQKGNTHRTRPQKYKNQFAFKNALHDTSHNKKKINNLQICNVCERCKKIIEWKIKYNKYKLLKTPGKCNKCNEKTVKQAYHTICTPCAREHNECPKCGNKSELIIPKSSNEEIKLNPDIQEMLKNISERKRRTFIRFMNKQTNQKTKLKENLLEKSDNISVEENKSVEYTYEQIFNKLKSLIINDKKNNDDKETNSSKEERNE